MKYQKIRNKIIQRMIEIPKKDLCLQNKDKELLFI